MNTWPEMSKDALEAAKALLTEGRFRSAVSRAYYAAYCALTGEIVKAVSAFAGGWHNPPHADVPQYIQNNLAGFVGWERKRLARLIRTLRLFRENADYRPHQPVDQQTAKDCIRDAAAIQRMLWRQE